MDSNTFWESIEKNVAEGACWEWTKAKDRRGYGRLYFQGKTLLAHRLAYSLMNGVLDPGICVCHRCDNPSCCNPSHLFLGTKADNHQDMMSKGRHPSITSPGYHSRGESHNQAKLTDAQVLEIVALYANEDISQRKLAAMYGVSQRTITKIVLGIGWKSVLNRKAGEVR